MMMSDYAVHLARAEDVRHLPAIELAAARLLAGHAPESVLEETTSEDVLLAAQAAGLLWVARSSATIVGFAHVQMLAAGAAHLAELDVHPDHGRRGIGRQLVEAVCSWALAAGLHAVTLTTFRDVPWNMPFYASMGFCEIPPDQQDAALVEVLRREADAGLDAALRVAMARRHPLTSS